MEGTILSDFMDPIFESFNVIQELKKQPLLLQKPFF
jgi:hypothetical protein